MTFNDVAPVGGDVIGKASNEVDAWMLCRRYGLDPITPEKGGAVELVASVWQVICQYSAFPYNRAAWENRYRDDLATLESGLPAWPVAEENGIAFSTFRQRINRGWSAERAATEGARQVTADPSDEVEAEAVRNGISVRAYRSRVRSGCPPMIAATMGLSWRKW